MQHVSPCLQWTGCREPLICPLSQLRAGSVVRIKHLAASAEISRRLREIGFLEEQIIKLLVCQANVICLVCNARLAIGMELAQTILVEPLNLPQAA